MTHMESELVQIAQYLVDPLSDELKNYCRLNSIPWNPALELTIDTIQLAVSPLKGGAYDRHNDVDRSNCDDALAPEEIAQLGRPKVNGTDVQVLTIVLSCAKPEHQVNLKIYYPKGSTKEIASLPSLGPVHAHLQYLLMQVAEHEVTNADCELGEGYRMVFSFRCLKPFQQDRAMVSVSWLL